jgi:hypothetical protein
MLLPTQDFTLIDKNRYFTLQKRAQKQNSEGLFGTFSYVFSQKSPKIRGAVSLRIFQLFNDNSRNNDPRGEKFDQKTFVVKMFTRELLARTLLWAARSRQRRYARTAT